MLSLLVSFSFYFLGDIRLFDFASKEVEL